MTTSSVETRPGSSPIESVSCIADCGATSAPVGADPANKRAATPISARDRRRRGTKLADMAAPFLARTSAVRRIAAGIDESAVACVRLGIDVARDEHLVGEDQDFAVLVIGGRVGESPGARIAPAGL